MVQLDRVTEHALSVVRGETPSGILHKLACKRHLNDLDRQKTTKFPFYWDVEAAERVLEYAETLTIAEGDEPRPVKLIPEQCFDIGSRFGWKKLNGYRRFRRSYKSVARQNGKTFENGIMGTYVAGFSGYNYGKLFTVATKKRQARLAWEEMSKFINVDEDLGQIFDVKDYKSLIECSTTKCTIEALSKESGLDDGFRSLFSSIDELHQHRDNRVYKAIYNGTRALNETLVSMITTRGDKLNSFCKDMDDYCVKILKGVATAEDFFVDIYSLDPEDNPWEEENWIKANPYLARTEQGLETLRTDAETAKDMGGTDLRDFLTKALNVWVNNPENGFIDVEKWAENGTERTLESFRCRPCWVGLDLSSGGDLTTLHLEFEEEGEKTWNYSHSFMPRGRLEEHIGTDLAPYDIWESMELITVTGGSSDYKNDYKFIIKHLRDLQKEYDLTFLGIGVDPHNADGILSDLEDFGCPVLIVTQSARNLNDATVDIQLLVKSKQYEYNQNNELLTWSFTNARVVKNSFDEIKVDKEPRAKFKRIDPVDAAIDAHAVKLKFKEKEVVDVGTELDNYLKKMGWA
ncbi:terminase large subunit [Proteiniclasticum sp. C24MP]|uniref:terminase large subunit n=1 Tax=Proteiniclasticum sp. C24MP TaxID=3374101 RepID=UPI0037547E54